MQHLNQLQIKMLLIFNPVSILKVSANTDSSFVSKTCLFNRNIIIDIKFNSICYKKSLLYIFIFTKRCNWLPLFGLTQIILTAFSTFISTFDDFCSAQIFTLKYHYKLLWWEHSFHV